MVKKALLNLCIKVTNADFFAQHESDEVQTEISTVAALNVSVDLFRKKIALFKWQSKTKCLSVMSNDLLFHEWSIWSAKNHYQWFMLVTSFCYLLKYKNICDRIRSCAIHSSTFEERYSPLYFVDPNEEPKWRFPSVVICTPHPWKMVLAFPSNFKFNYEPQFRSLWKVSKFRT